MEVSNAARALFFMAPRSCLVAMAFAILRLMSIRRAGGDWEPMLLGIEPRTCRVCLKGLYRDVTLLKGGWARCTVCNEFIHYCCLAAGKSGFFKARPRVCRTCREKVTPMAPDDVPSHASTVG